MPKKPDHGFVYFILSPAGYCKVGWAIDPATRLEQLEAATGEALELWHKVATNDPPWLESKLHRFFHRARARGEWFKLGQEELAAVLSLERCDRLVIDGRCFDDVEDLVPGPVTDAATKMGGAGGKKGGPARAAKLSPERRREIARMGGLARGKSPPPPQ